jgi:hypothetical protein
MIKIPDKVVEATARGLARYNCDQWDSDPERFWPHFADQARAACLAMLEAWPGARERPYWDFMTNARHVEIILPQEARDE